MRSLSLAFALALASAQAPAQAPQWAFTLDSPGSEDVQHMATAADGSVTVVGRLDVALDLDPGPGDHVLDPGAASNASYVARYDNDGALEWAFPLLSGTGANEEAEVSDLAVAPDGTVYLSIELNGTVELAPLGTSVSITATSVGSGYTNAQDLLLAVYATDGNHAWHKHVKGDGARLVGGNAMHLAMRDQGEVLLCGGYAGSIDLDQTFTGSTDSLHATALSNPRAFVAQYAADGTLEWAFDFDEECAINGLADAQPGIMIALQPFGSDGTVDLDPGSNIVLYSDTNSYLLRYDMFFNQTGQLAVSGSLGYAVQELIATGPNNFAWVAAFEGTATVGDSIYAGFGPGHVYIAHWSSSPPGLWSRYMQMDNAVTSLAAVGDGSMHLAFEFDVPVDLDGSATDPAAVLTPYGDDVAVVHYAADGSFLDAWHIGDAVHQVDDPHIAFDATGHLFLGAQIEGTIDVDPRPAIVNASATAGADGGLVVKYGDLPTSVPALMPVAGPSLWPVPTNAELNVRVPTTEAALRWEVMNALGARVALGSCTLVSGACALEVGHLPSGTYVVHATTSNATWCLPFVTQ